MGDPTSPNKRMTSLDVFRGITIVGMILVNNPGTWSAIYPPLRHAEWHGWTPTDLVFPFFLFIVGVAIVFAFEKRLALGVEKTTLAKKVVRRSLILFGLGLFMAAYPFFQFSPEFGLVDKIETLRIMGVLQRIAVCYLVVSLLYIYVKPNLHWWIMGGFLLVYTILMAWVPVPGYGAGLWDDPEGNLAAYLDRMIFGDHLWVGTERRWDPEGLLSTLPALVTTFLGVWTGQLLRASWTPDEKLARLLVRGCVLVGIGYVLQGFIPINKPLWTPSYALFTGGQAMVVLGLCYWFIDVKGYTRWTQPFVVYGVNALTVFVMSGLLALTLIYIQVGDTSLQRFIFESVFLPIASPINASLLYALTWIAGWYVVLRWMHKRNLIIKV